jgi:hypothetical protein
MKINEIDPGEKIDISDTNNIYHFIDLIHTHCSEAIAGMKQANKFLYRGINGVPSMFHGKPRSDRQPTNKNRTESQKMFDIALAKQGIEANRSNSIFCSGSVTQAMIYGLDDNDVYCIFPTNGFKFVWSPKVRDIVNDPDYNWRNRYEQEFYDRYVIRKDYTNQALGEAIKSGHEIMIAGEYYAIRSNLAGGVFWKYLVK